MNLSLRIKMPKKFDKNLMVGLDIGTSKIVTLIGQMSADDHIEVMGIGKYPARGLKRGVVVNIDAAVQSIQRSIEEAELSAGCQIYSVYVGIAGSHIYSINAHGSVAIRDREVTQADVDRVIDAARAVVIPADQKILHILPQEFMIDQQEGIWDPIGMAGTRLEANVHLVIGAVSAAQNIIKCIERCGLTASDIILEQLASSHAVLTEDEKELGVCLVDIGGGTTDIAVFFKGAIAHTAVIPIAGDQVTNDIAIALHTPIQTAEALKLKHGYSVVDLVKDDHIFEVKGFGEPSSSPVTETNLAEIIGSRYEELFSLIQTELHRMGLYDRLAAGIVLTGGASKMRGVIALAEAIFEMPVRLGSPQQVRGSEVVSGDPMYSTSVGLLLYGQKQRQYQLPSYDSNTVWRRMKQWFQSNF